MKWAPLISSRPSRVRSAVTGRRKPCQPMRANGFTSARAARCCCAPRRETAACFARTGAASVRRFKPAARDVALPEVSRINHLLPAHYRLRLKGVTMTKRYDFIALGSGTAARAAALQVRAAGRTVTVIDFRPFGGTCALRGCDPKKMLVGATSAVDHLRRMRAHGVVGEARIDWAALTPRGCSPLRSGE